MMEGAHSCMIGCDFVADLKLNNFGACDVSDAVDVVPCYADDAAHYLV